MGLVTDVERYPDFVPAMSALRKTRDLPDGFEAEALISFKGISESFKSRVIIDEEARTIIVEKATRGGPVKTLHNRWQFFELPDGSTLVDFAVEVRLAFPLESLLRQKFDKAKRVIRNVFVDQAQNHCEPLGEKPDIDLAGEVVKLGLDTELIYAPPLA